MLSRSIVPVFRRCGVRMMSDHLGQAGKGAGKTGGSGGTIREAGGAFGKLEAAREEEYFYKLQKEQMKGLKKEIQKEIEHHEAQQRSHADTIARHKKRIAELEQEVSQLGKK